MKRIFVVLGVILVVSCSSNSKDKEEVESPEEEVRTEPKIESNSKYVLFQQLCNDEEGTFLDDTKRKLYGKFNPYDIIESDTNNKHLIQFDFITDCCDEFIGDFQVVNDTLILYYFSDDKDGLVCDCYCDYRMIYFIPIHFRPWNGFKIVNGSMI